MPLTRYPEWARGVELDDARLAHIIETAGAGHLDVIRGGVSEAIAGAADGLSLLRRLAAERASLRVRRIHVLDERVKELAFRAHRFFSEEIGVNAYWSPAGCEMGLAPHSDPYDIVVLQVAGEKRWTLLSEAPREISLGAGDHFSLPRGLRHRAEVVGKLASLHLAVGIHAKTKKSLVEWLAAELARDGGELTADALKELHAEVNALLLDPRAKHRFLEHRRAVEYERMLMTPEEHARSDARGYR